MHFTLNSYEVYLYPEKKTSWPCIHVLAHTRPYRLDPFSDRKRRYICSCNECLRVPTLKNGYNRQLLSKKFYEVTGLLQLLACGYTECELVVF